MNKNEEKLCKGCGKVKANTDYSKELETLREKVDWYWQCLDLANYFFDFLDEEDFDGDQPQHLYKENS